MAISPDALVRRSSQPVETMVGTEIVLMSLDAGECYGLGETGSDIWRLLAEPTTPKALAARLRGQYEAPEGEIEHDVEELLEELRRLRLVDVLAVEPV